MSAYLQLIGFRQMAADDLQGGTVTYGGESLPATIGVFECQQDLIAGGYSPHATAMLEIANEDLPANTTLATGQLITASPTTGKQRECFIRSFIQEGALWQLHVQDKNQNA